MPDDCAGLEICLRSRGRADSASQSTCMMNTAMISVFLPISADSKMCWTPEILHMDAG